MAVSTPLAPLSNSGLTAVPDYSSSAFVNGFNLTIASSTTFTLSPGSARALTSDYVIQYPSFEPGVPANITVNVSTVGLNGCWPVSIASLALANDTLFPVYVCANQSGTTGGSLNANAAQVGAFLFTGGTLSLPGGNNQYRRVGWAYIDHSTGNLLPLVQFGNANERTYLLQNPVTALSAGAETTATAIDLTNNSGVGVVPPAVVSVNLNVSLTGNAAAAYARLQPFNLTASSVTPTQLVTTTASQPLATNMNMVVGLNASGNASIKYLVNNSGSALTLLVAGFTESLANSLV